MLSVAVDAMGGDDAPRAIVAGALDVARQGPALRLCGDLERLRPLLPPDVGVDLEHWPRAVAMDDKPSHVLRGPADTSIHGTLQSVAEGRAAAAVSCGHTGVVMALAAKLLGRAEGIHRPALATLLPRTDGGSFVLLDLGANVDTTPRHLVQFARMGAAFSTVATGLGHPRVGLLANGEEASKGNELVREAHGLFVREVPGFVGNVEPRGAFRGDCDVLVCDGFVGNVLLKTAEATVEIGARLFLEELSRRPSARMGAFLLQGALARLSRRVDWSSFGGALLLGVKGVVVVGHGRSDARAVASAIRLAHRCAAEHLAARVTAIAAAS